MASPSRVWAFSRTRSSSRAACQVARSTTGGRPGSAVVGSSGVVVMVSSVVSRAGQRRTTSYDGHQYRLPVRPELIAAGGAPRPSAAVAGLAQERIDTHRADPGGKPGDFAGETHPLPHRLLCLSGHYDQHLKKLPSLSSTFIGSTTFTFEAEGMKCAHCRRA